MEPLNRIQKFAIVIPGIFILGAFISEYVERFRGDKNLRWIYVDGKDYSLIMCYGTALWSILNSILILQNLKTEKTKKILWFLLSVSTFLYLFIMMTIAMTRDI